MSTAQFLVAMRHVVSRLYSDNVATGSFSPLVSNPPLELLFVEL